MISVLLPCYKSADLLRKVFIPGLYNCSVDCEVIVYDNGGNNLEENSLDKEFSFYSKNNSTIDWKPIGDGQNIGLNAALNKCAKVSTGEYFYLCHSDMFLLPNCLESLLEEAKKHAPGSYLFCSRSVEPIQGHTPFHIIKNYGQSPDEFQGQKLLDDFKDYNDNSIVTGYRMPFFMHRKLWDKMNGVDERFFSYATDDDLFLEAYEKNVRKFWMINNSLVYHLVGKSNNQQTVDKDSNKPYEILKDKWKHKYNMNHPLDSLLQSLIPWNYRIR